MRGVNLCDLSWRSDGDFTGWLATSGIVTEEEIRQSNLNIAMMWSAWKGARELDEKCANSCCHPGPLQHEFCEECKSSQHHRVPQHSPLCNCNCHRGGEPCL